jgi:hypothetical protein
METMTATAPGEAPCLCRHVRIEASGDGSTATATCLSCGRTKAVPPEAARIQFSAAFEVSEPEAAGLEAAVVPLEDGELPVALEAELDDPDKDREPTVEELCDRIDAQRIAHAERTCLELEAADAEVARLEAEDAAAEDGEDDGDRDDGE